MTGITYFAHKLRFMPVFSEAFFLKVLAEGVSFGSCALILVEMLKLGERLSRTIRIWAPWKGVLAGFALIGLTALFSLRYLGLGLDTIEGAIAGTPAPWYAFLVKSLFTSITLTFGGSGGIVTPIIFIGATAGSFFGGLTGLDPGTFAAIGLVCLLAGAANAPLAAAIMAVELFGPELAPYAAGACIVSFLMTGHRSVYPSQILSFRKSPSIFVHLGEEIELAQPHFRPRKLGLITKGVRLWRNRRRRPQKKAPPDQATGA